MISAHETYLECIAETTDAVSKLRDATGAKPLCRMDITSAIKRQWLENYNQILTEGSSPSEVADEKRRNLTTNPRGYAELDTGIPALNYLKSAAIGRGTTIKEEEPHSQMASLSPSEKNGRHNILETRDNQDEFADEFDSPANKNEQIQASETTDSLVVKNSQASGTTSSVLVSTQSTSKVVPLPVELDEGMSVSSSAYTMGSKYDATPEPEDCTYRIVGQIDVCETKASKESQAKWLVTVVNGILLANHQEVKYGPSFGEDQRSPNEEGQSKGLRHDQLFRMMQETFNFNGGYVPQDEEAAIKPEPSD